MADFIRADLRGSRFEHVDRSGAQFRWEHRLYAERDLDALRARGA